MQPVRCAALAFPLLLLAAPTWADSDGYYCIGPDYLAYQFGLAAPPIAPHHLYVVRLGGKDAMSKPATIEMPQFQVQGMHCGGDAVQLEAFDGLYTVHLDPLRRPVRCEFARAEDGRPRTILWGSHAARLGGFGFSTNGLASERRSLMNLASGHEFAIEIAPKLLRSKPCQTEITTRLLELDASRKIVRAQVVHKGGLCKFRVVSGWGLKGCHCTGGAICASVAFWLRSGVTGEIVWLEPMASNGVQEIGSPRGSGREDRRRHGPYSYRRISAGTMRVALRAG
jgi:hypothetical protein